MYTYKARIDRVVDGDTVDATVDLGFYMQAKIRFRLAGIDTPEIRGKERPEGLKVKAWMVALVEGRTVTIKTAKAGKFGRWLAWLYVDGDETSVNETLIKKGMAKEYGGGKR